jgi:hypothetical protein
LTCQYDASLNPDDNTLYHRLSLGLESLGEAADVVLDLAVVAEELDVSTVDLDTAGSLALQVLITTERGEAPVLGDNDLLATRELVLRAAESLKSQTTVYEQVSIRYSRKSGRAGHLNVLESRVRTLMMI